MVLLKWINVLELWPLLDLGVGFLMEYAFWTFCTWVFHILRVNRGKNPSFPKQEAWSPFLTSKIQRESKDAILLHLSFFMWKMVIFVRVWLTQHLFWFTSRLPSWTLKAENLETRFLRLPCSWGAGMWPSFPQPIALTQDSDVKVSSVRSGHRLADWTTGWETGPSRKHRGRGVKSSGEMGRNFARSVPNTRGGD